MRENKDTYKIRRMLYKEYDCTAKKSSPNWKQLWLNEINQLLGTDYTVKDLAGIPADGAIVSKWREDWKFYGPDKFYGKSKAFVISNLAYLLSSYGFDILRMFAKHYKKGKSILNYGGGTGDINIMAERMGLGSTANLYIDLPGVMFKTAEQRFDRRDCNVCMEKARKDRIWGGDANIDFIVCTDVLEHVPFAEKLAQRLCDWLTPKGKLLLTYSFGTSGENITHLPQYDKGTGRKIIKILKENGVTLKDKNFKGFVKLFVKE